MGALNNPKKKLCPKLEKKVNTNPNRIILKFKLFIEQKFLIKQLEIKIGIIIINKI
tara:strand:+ start:538 stop:705 length:168 start_codon:yes stop_codon:yes gene_type:complete